MLSVGGDRLVGGECQALVGGPQALDERRTECLGAQQGRGERLQVGAGRHELHRAQSGGRAGHRLSGAAGQRTVPVRDRIGNERLEAQRTTVTAGAVAARFPDAFDELGQGAILSESRRSERISTEPFVSR